MFAMIHVLLHERPREHLDLPFLRDRTSSPYLVGPNGYYLRDAATAKPLVWDTRRAAAVPFDTPGAVPALDGEFTVEPRPSRSDRTRSDGRIATSRRSRRLRNSLPTSALTRPSGRRPSARCPRRVFAGRKRVSRSRARRRDDRDRWRAAAVSPGVGDARQDSEQRLGGVRLRLGTHDARGAGRRTGSSGRHGRDDGSLNRPHEDRHKSVKPGEDGFMAHTPESDRPESAGSPTRAGATLTARSCRWSAMAPGARPSVPRTSPNVAARSARASDEAGVSRRCGSPTASTRRSLSGIHAALAETIARFPFMVSFAYTIDETNWMADVLLPEATDFESLQLIRLANTKFVEQFSEHEGFALRQPAVAPRGETRDFTWIVNELARRVGLLEAVQPGHQSRRGRGSAQGRRLRLRARSGTRAFGRGDLGRGLQGGDCAAVSAARMCTTSSGSASTAFTCGRRRSDAGICTRRLPRRVCASNCRTRSA